MASNSAAAKVFAIPELLEKILLFTSEPFVGSAALRWDEDFEFLFTAKRVSKDFACIIAETPSLRRMMLLEQSSFLTDSWVAPFKEGVNPLVSWGRSKFFVPMRLEVSWDRGVFQAYLQQPPTDRDDGWVKPFLKGELPIQSGGSWRETMLDCRTPPLAACRVLLYPHGCDSLGLIPSGSSFAEFDCQNTLGGLVDGICLELQGLVDKWAERAKAKAKRQAKKSAKAKACAEWKAQRDFSGKNTKGAADSQNCSSVTHAVRPESAIEIDLSDVECLQADDPRNEGRPED